MIVEAKDMFGIQGEIVDECFDRDFPNEVHNF